MYWQHRVAIWTLAAGVSSFGISSPRAATVLNGFSDSVLVSGLRGPTAMAFAPDGRLFVAQQRGRVRVIKNGTLLTTPFATLDVDAVAENGLGGIAIDPNFAANRFVYVYYTVPGSPKHNRITRFTASGDVALPGSARTILDLDPLGPEHHHNGGALHFGSDGKLYVGVGENFVPANSQSLSNRLGKLLRINRDGTIPPDNPTSFQGLAGTTSGANRAIWAVGLRNPFTFAVQPTTGKIFINDVGKLTWEEINIGVRGRNYGWPTTEGPTSDPRFTGPVFAYRHQTGTPQGCSIAGGTFYNPATVQFPASYVGKYFFADWCSGWINVIDSANPGAATEFASGIPRPVDLDVGPGGALYYLARVGGLVGRIRYTGTTIQAILTSTDRLTVNEGGSAAFTVRLAKAPAANVTVALASTIGDPAVAFSPASLTFTPADWSNPRTVTVAAAQDADAFDDGAAVRLTAPGLARRRVVATSVDDDRPAGAPRAIITLPRNGDLVSGAGAEFFGDGIDAAGSVVRAEFYVDGVRRYTDVNAEGHYHINGAHNAWDTRTLSNGVHTLRMRLIDNTGLGASHQITVTVAN
jgi:glucose/arabinose dehydrogenase